MSNEENLTFREKVTRALNVGTSPEALAVLIKEWGKDEAHADLETEIRQDLNLAPPEESTPSENRLESFVRDEMARPSREESEPLFAPGLSPELREKRLRQQMNLGPGGDNE